MTLPSITGSWDHRRSVSTVSVEPGAAVRCDCGLSCPLYAAAEGLVATAPGEWVTAALKR